MASHGTKAPATPPGPGAARRGSDRGPHLSWSGRTRFGSAARAGEERRAGSAWPGPRRSLHPRPAEGYGRFQPGPDAPFMRAPARRGVRAGQARRGMTAEGPADVRRHLRCRAGDSVLSEQPVRLGRVINATVRRGGAGPEGAGRLLGPAPPRPGSPRGGTPRAARPAPAGLAAGWARAAVWAVGPQRGLAS